MKFDWTQQTCLLTGAAGGIGREIARQLANKGVSLILTGRDQRKLLELKNRLPGIHEIVAADITRSEGRDEIEDRCMYSSKLTMLINNAGISHVGAFDMSEAEEIEHLLTVNLLAPILLTKQLLPLLTLQDHAHIINVGSAFGSIGFAGHSSYCASKFGLRGWTESLQREYADSQLQFYYFAPRATQTGINSAVINDMNSALGNHVDSPSDVAAALIKQIEAGKQRYAYGFPEKFFVRLNGFLPELVDKALKKKLATVNHYIRPEFKEN